MPQAWTRHAQKEGITSTNSQYQKQYAAWVKENYSQRYATFQLFDLSKRVRHYVSDLDALNDFNELGDVCDFENKNLQSLAVLQNMRSLGKVINTLATTYHHGLLAQVFVTASRLLVRTPEGRGTNRIARLAGCMALLCCLSRAHSSSHSTVHIKTRTTNQ